MKMKKIQTTKENQINQSYYHTGRYNGRIEMFETLFGDGAFREEWIIFNLRCHLEEKYSVAFKGIESERHVKD